MRKFLTTAMAVALVSATSYADLQNVEVGGSIQIRGNSYFAGDDGDTTQYTEQRTTINVAADFSDEVSAFIELDNYGYWGDDLRDTPGNNDGGTGNSAAQVYQSYITLGEAWGTAFDLKIGRQEVMLGSEFLIGNNSTAAAFTHLSYDGITAVYNADTYNVTLLSLKAAENDATGYGAGKDNDIDIYGVYGSYTGREDMVIDGYWLYVDSGAGNAPGADGDQLHTLGVRVDGASGAIDYEVEVAYQTGEMSDTVDYDGMAVNAEVGYSFDTDYQPRVFLGVALFEGPDGGDLGFNRLFSDWEYSEFLSNTDLRNALIIRLGGSLQATEKIALSTVISHFELDEEEADFGGISSGDDFTGNTEDTIGQELGLYATYAYSEDVAMEVGYAHFFIEDDLFGNIDDLDYVYGQVSISF